MKKILLSCFLSISITSAFCQPEPFKKGQTDIQIGAGFITPFFELDYYDVRTKTPPVILTIDHGITDQLSVGGYFATARSDVYGTIYWSNGTSSFSKQSTLTHIIIGGRLLYHFVVSPTIDLYGGGMIGYNLVREKAEPNIELIGKTELQGLTYSILGGGRYRFTPNIGVFTEIGYGVTVVNIGLNLKLP